MPSFFVRFFFFMCICAHRDTHMCGRLERAAEAIGCPGAGVTDFSSMPNLETGTRTPVFGQQQALLIAEPSL